MTKWMKLGIAGAVLVAGVGVASSVGAESECDGLRAAYAEGLELPPQVMHGTNGSVVIAPDGTEEMVKLQREMEKLGC